LLLGLSAAAAAGCFRRALELTPDDASALAGCGLALMALDRPEEGIELHAAAVRAAPEDPFVLFNYGLALRECNRQEEALAAYGQALARIPENAPRRATMEWEPVLAALDLGRYAETWPAFELRWKQRIGIERVFAQPRWKGEAFAGKTILVYEEQGYGDTILCARYLPLVKARGGNVIFETKPELHRLFAGMPGVDALAAPGSALPAFDLQCPIMSLPGIFGTHLGSIPPVPELRAAPPSPEAARLLALGGNRFKVGIIWSGSVTFSRNHKRATTADRFLPFAEIPGVQLYSLQKGAPEQELAACAGRSLVWELGPHLNDFAETASVLKALDLVIMTDSSVAHLAGSLNVPVWNLLNYRPYWLYLKERADSPWYPSMRLIRQPRPGDWDSVFAETGEFLRDAVALKKAGQWPPRHPFA
jgi:hypothetical protein